jgi:hypothetical protein
VRQLPLRVAPKAGVLLRVLLVRDREVPSDASRRRYLLRQVASKPGNTLMTTSADFCCDLEEVLRYLHLGDPRGLGSLHRAQDLQSFLMHREAVKLLRADPTLVERVGATLSRWMERADPHSRPLLERWTQIVAARDWDAALASSDEAQQLRQASPFAGLLPEDTRLAIIKYVWELKRSG